MNIFNMTGLLGAFIGGYAYLPQIHHLIQEKCTAGLSPGAFKLWTLSSALLLSNAIYIHSVVFIVLGIIQLTATITILSFSIRNKGHVCEPHALGHKVLVDGFCQ